MKYLIYVLILILASISVSAVVIEGVESNQEKYANGDTIKITLYANANDLDIKSDFSGIDSNFNLGAVLVEQPQNFTYNIFYSITYSNTKGNGAYSSLITVYNKESDTSNVISYAINLDNTLRLNRTEEWQNIKLKTYQSRENVPDTNITQIQVNENNIMVCTSLGCDTLTKEEYDRARRLVITDGTVELSNLTYNQLKNQIQTDVTASVNQELANYINQVIDINKNLNRVIGEFRQTMADNQEILLNQTNQTQIIVQRTFYTNIASVIIVLLLIIAAFYLLYLKTCTTWLNG